MKAGRTSWGIPWRGVLDVTAALAMIAASSVFIWAVLSMREQARTEAPVRAGGGAAPTRPLPSQPVGLDGAALVGRPGVRVAMIVYADFQCPYCRAFARDTLPAIRERYVGPGKVQLGFRQLPLEARHPFALKAAEAAECGRRQDRFWQMHDALFAEPLSLDSESLTAKAGAAGLDLARFATCMQGEATEKVRQDMTEARALAVTGTPTFLFGTIERDGNLKVIRRESGALPIEALVKILDQVLVSAGPNAHENR